MGNEHRMTDWTVNVHSGAGLLVPRRLILVFYLFQTGQERRLGEKGKRISEMVCMSF